MSVLNLPLLVDLQHRVGELILPTTLYPSIIILENTLNVYRKNMVMVTLTTGMFIPFTCMHFWVWGFLLRWSACAPTAYEVGHDCLRFEKH
jgi:hypothetical protein